MRYNVTITRGPRVFEAGENQELQLHYSYPDNGPFKAGSTDEAADKALEDFNENFSNDTLILITTSTSEK